MPSIPSKGVHVLPVSFGDVRLFVRVHQRRSRPAEETDTDMLCLCRLAMKAQYSLKQLNTWRTSHTCASRRSSSGFYLLEVLGDVVNTDGAQHIVTGTTYVLQGVRQATTKPRS